MFVIQYTPRTNFSYAIIDPPNEALPLPAAINKMGLEDYISYKLYILHAVGPIQQDKEMKT